MAAIAGRSTSTAEHRTIAARNSNGMRPVEILQLHRVPYSVRIDVYSNSQTRPHPYQIL